MKNMKAYIKITKQNVTPEELEQVRELIKDIPGAKLIIEGETE
jgi:hypothetical protein